MLIDTHAHLYSRKFDQDREDMLQRAIEEGVEQFLLPNVDSESIEAMLALETAHPDKCMAMMGLHPCSVKENYKEELALVKEWLDKRPFLAVGEIGIDLYWDKTFFEQQKEAFLLQVEWALELDLPIVIHARESLDVLIELVGGVEDSRLRGVFHCFTGTLAQAEAIIKLGFYLGIGGVATYKNSGLTEVLANVPLESVILETDAPYLAPVPKRGKRNESAYLRHVAEHLAGIYELPLEALAETTSRNARKLFQLNSNN